MNRKLKFRLGLGVALGMISAIVVLYFYVYQSHRDIDAEKVVKPLFEIGFSSYLLLGSDVADFKKAIDNAFNG